jgi:hypothetical protein
LFVCLLFFLLLCCFPIIGTRNTFKILGFPIVMVWVESPMIQHSVLWELFLYSLFSSPTLAEKSIILTQWAIGLRYIRSILR